MLSEIIDRAKLRWIDHLNDYSGFGSVRNLMKLIKHNSKELNKVKIQRDMAYAIAFLVTVLTVGGFIQSRRIVSPCPSEGCFVKVVYAKEPTTEYQDVISEITRVFGPEGKGVLKEALAIAFCEHGWQKGDKPHLNDNGSYDWGTFQINTVWEKVYNTKFHTDYVENIRVAHEIWLRSKSFNAWVCQRYI